MQRTLKRLITAVVIAVPSMVSAQATTVGTFNANGSANLTFSDGVYSVSFMGITAAQALNGIFAPINVGDAATVQTVPLTAGATSIPSFLTIDGFRFNVTQVVAGSAGSANCSVPVAAVGQRCTPAGTGLTLSNVGDPSDIDTSVLFNLRGTVTPPTGGQTYNFSGIFTSQLAGTTYQQVLARVSQPGGTQPLGISFTITASSTVPEPATVTLMAGGLVAMLGMGVMRRRGNA